MLIHDSFRKNLTYTPQTVFSKGSCCSDETDSGAILSAQKSVTCIFLIFYHFAFSFEVAYYYLTHYYAHGRPSVQNRLPHRVQSQRLQR